MPRSLSGGDWEAMHKALQLEELPWVVALGAKMSLAHALAWRGRHGRKLLLTSATAVGEGRVGNVRVCYSHVKVQRKARQAHNVWSTGMMIAKPHDSSPPAPS
jgi:hypothetical protein